MAITGVLFPVLILLGIFLRTVQAGGLAPLQSWFYPMMTLHGVGMVWCLVCRRDGRASARCSRVYVEPTPLIGRVAIIGTLLGVGLLLACVFFGRYAAGWYSLTRCPSGRMAAVVHSCLFLVSLTVLGATWLLWSLDLLRAICQAVHDLPGPRLALPGRTLRARGAASGADHDVSLIAGAALLPGSSCWRCSMSSCSAGTPTDAC